MAGDHQIFRHSLWVRLTHWINVVCMTVLLMSGLQIFNAHPALYWGDRSRFDQPRKTSHGARSTAYSATPPVDAGCGRRVSR